MATYVKRLSFDVVSLLAFGYPLNTQTDLRDRWITEGVTKGNFRINSYMQFSALRHTTKIDWLLYVISRGARRQYGELVSRIVGTRLAQNKDARPDLFVLMTNKENLQGERPIPHLEIFQEAVFFLPPVPTRRHRHMRVVVLPFA